MYVVDLNKTALQAISTRALKTINFLNWFDVSQEKKVLETSNSIFLSHHVTNAASLYSCIDKLYNRIRETLKKI